MRIHTAILALILFSAPVIAAEITAEDYIIAEDSPTPFSDSLGYSKACQDAYEEFLDTEYATDFVCNGDDETAVYSWAIPEWATEEIEKEKLNRKIEDLEKRIEYLENLAVQVIKAEKRKIYVSYQGE